MTLSTDLRAIADELMLVAPEQAERLRALAREAHILEWGLVRDDGLRSIGDIVENILERGMRV